MKERIQDRTTKDATPSSTKKAPSSGKDTVEYWLAKGELPTGDPELKRKVVNAKIAGEKAANTNTAEGSVISSIPSAPGLIIK
jgi:hypothetical protein